MFFIAALSLILVAALIPFASRQAIKLGLVDKPGGRKVHCDPVAPIGGLVIFPVFLCFLLLFHPFAQIWPLISALLLLLVLGAVDDAKPVNAKLKFVCHFVAAILIVVFGHANLENMGYLFSHNEVHFGWFAPIFSIMCAVYLINAMNMMDGIDGLAGGLAAIFTMWFMVAAALAGAIDEQAQLFVLLGALLGFLIHNARYKNHPCAKVFLGDAGSMAIGLILAWYAMRLSQSTLTTLPPISYAFIVALPIWDAFGLLAMRIKEGRPPFDPDKRHFHHHFLAAGYTPEQATPRILAYAFTLGLIGVALPSMGVPEPIMTAIWCLFWFGHTWLTMRPEPFIALLQKRAGNKQHNP